MIQKLANNLSKLFLIDAVGAITAFILLFFVIGGLEEVFGMPAEVCQELSYFALLFFVYSLGMSLSKPQDSKRFLKILISLNSGYGLLSVVVVILHASLLTPLGWIYFSFDLLFLLLVVVLEISVYRNVPADE